MKVTAKAKGGRRPGAGRKPVVDGFAVAEQRRRRRTWNQVAVDLRVSKWTAMKAFKRIACRTCDGSGRDRADAAMVCGRCRGSLTVERMKDAS